MLQKLARNINLTVYFSWPRNKNNVLCYRINIKKMCFPPKCGNHETVCYLFWSDSHVCTISLLVRVTVPSDFIKDDR